MCVNGQSHQQKPWFLRPGSLLEILKHQIGTSWVCKGQLQQVLWKVLSKWCVSFSILPFSKIKIHNTIVTVFTSSNSRNMCTSLLQAIVRTSMKCAYRCPPPSLPYPVSLMDQPTSRQVVRQERGIRVNSAKSKCGPHISGLHFVPILFIFRSIFYLIFTSNNFL